MAWFFNLALIVAAILYATVGHGGASSYLAIFALSGDVTPQEMRASALVLNLCVSMMAFLNYQSRRFFDRRTFGILIITSVPAAFLGGLLSIPAESYKMLLGGFLLLVVLRMFGLFGKSEIPPRRMALPAGLICGALLGFISGIIGIGGGIMLSPLLLLLGWAPMKTTAGVSAAFIFVNSAAGLAGLYSSDQLHLHADIPWWILFVLIGGLTGSLVGSRYLSGRQVRWILATVLVVASAKLLLL